MKTFHLAPSDSPTFVGMIAGRRQFVDARRLRLVRRDRRFSTPRPLAGVFRVRLAVCGRMVEYLCRELRRHHSQQHLAPLPDFCTPTCADCLVAFDVAAESGPLGR